MQAPQVVPIPTQRFSYVPKFQPQTFQKTNVAFTPQRQHQQNTTQNTEFDGKRLRKAVTRKTVDYNSSVIKYLENRVWQRDYRDRRAMQPDPAYYTEMTPPLSMPDNPINAVTTKFVRTSTNKMRCPIFCVAWTPEGRRLVTGASSGEFTLWNGLTFNFETILQAHDSPVRCMVWSHNDMWMVTGDHAGYVKYWQSNMNNVKMFQAHKEPLRGISFCPVDTKFVTCSDDGTVRIWDFLKCFEEKILRGHGADVKCVDWHPTKSLIVSGSKDSQQPIKLWDPKSAQSLATIHAHKNTVMDAKWNKNGNWLLTASRDHLIKLFDIRNMNQEMQTFRGHKKEATTLAWHPTHEGLFTSGGSDGCVMFWVVGADKEVGCMEQAHDSCVWSLAWHPLGHILCSGSNDHSSKFWTRNRPGDRMRDKYNLNTLPKGQEDAADYDDSSTISCIPGMGLEYGLPDHLKPQENSYENEVMSIPGLDFTSEESLVEKSTTQKKIPFSKPIPKNFQQQWMESKQPLLLAPLAPPVEQHNSNGEVSTNINTETKPPPPPPPPPPPSLLLPTEQHRNNKSFPDQSPPSQRPPSSTRSALLGERPSGPPNRGRPERYPPPHPIRGEEEFQPDNMPPRSGQFPSGDRFHGSFSQSKCPPNRGRSERYPPHPIRGEEEEFQPDNFPPRSRQSPSDDRFHGSFSQSKCPPNRGRQERYPPPHPIGGEEEFQPDNMPPRSGQSPSDDGFHGSFSQSKYQNQAPPMPKTDMHVGNMPHNNRPYPENEEKFPIDHYDHHRNNEMPHETWRTYDDVHPEEMDVVPNNDMNPENGAFHHNPEIQHGFEPHNNLGPPTNRGRPERYPPHPIRREEEFQPNNMPPRNEQPPYDDRFHGDEDMRNNHVGPPGPGSDEMGFVSHKRSWNDGPNREDHYRPVDFDGPSPNFNPRQHRGSGQMFHGHRGGQRGSFRGMRGSPYRVVNRGRGRGGYS